MILSESKLEFEFSEEFKAIKFDDTRFYQKSFGCMPNAKGVDFIAISNNTILFIEVKNCIGSENDNRYRIEPDNRKLNTASTTIDTSKKESLDIEFSKKIAMTLACLIGAHTRHNFQNSDALKEYSSAVLSSDIADGKKLIKVLLFLEGDFGTHTRPKVLIMKALADSIKKKLSWLNCNVFVEDSNTQKKTLFTVTT